MCMGKDGGRMLAAEIAFVFSTVLRKCNTFVIIVKKTMPEAQ